MHSKDFDHAFRGPLHGVRVLDLSRLVAGNMLSLQLADHGADVIKVEPPGTGDPLRHWRPRGVAVSWKVYGRNKQSITLNMNRDPRYRSNEERIAHRDEVDAIVGGWIGERTLEEAMDVFDREAVTVAPVYDIAQISEDRHFNEREIIVELPDDDLGSVPHHNVFPRLSATPGGFRRPAPALGEHNAEILAELGLSDLDVQALVEQNVI